MRMPEKVKENNFFQAYVRRLSQQSKDHKDGDHVQINPEEVKSALGVFTVFMAFKAYHWLAGEETKKE